jgi:hypothetical protein
MSLAKAIEELMEARTVIDSCIAALSRLQIKEVPCLPELLREPSRRGRKFMGAEERRQVSERMKAVWAKLREERTE